ncbi:MAG: DUF2007 domain-containing protein [Verrucomicrobia bacterium]|nr:DUF2007 domain-containing protein [Verrucomicrobiota bacterium]
MQLTTVFQTFDPTEAELVRSRLEAAGFPVQVTEEHSGLPSMATGAILVQVPKAQAEEAQTLVDSTSDAAGQAG